MNGYCFTCGDYLPDLNQAAMCESCADNWDPPPIPENLLKNLVGI